MKRNRLTLDLSIRQPNGTEIALPTTLGREANPAWSPDGNWMLVVEKDSPFAPSPTTTGDFLDRLWLIRIYYDNGFVYEDDAKHKPTAHR